MYAKEAIEYLEKERGLRATFSNVSNITRAFVNKAAIKALQKQIPKKVLYEDVGFDCCYDINLYACICPSCGLHIIDFSDDDVDSKCNSDNPEDMFHSSMVHHAYIGMNNYCNRCGQKLDWGENHDR